MAAEEENIKHESFGQVEFHRTNGTAKFYGSELQQDHYIVMTVSPSEISRSLTDDRYHPDTKKLIQVRMSSSQFAELITALNIGGGVPCTVEVVDGKRMADLPDQESRKEFVHRKFKDRMRQFANTIRARQQQTKELVKKKTLSKEDVRDLTQHLDWLTAEVEQNIPFFAECFQETMDAVVVEAKTEVESALLHKVNMLGLAALHADRQLNANNEKSEQS